MSSIDYKKEKSMSDCKIYQADTVDIYGNVWPTVGENIRNGILGENVKVGYVDINNGELTSTDFNIIINDGSHFRINNIQCFFVLAKNITKGSLNLTFVNHVRDGGEKFAMIGNNNYFNSIIATIKIIYKDLE